jgi:hypothetical protein
MDPRLAEIIDELLEIVQAHPQDLNWQSFYDDQQELLHDLRDHAERARCGDGSRLPELKDSLAPTGPLNEIAFSSGWGDAYVRLANEFDDLYAGPWSPRREQSLLASRNHFASPRPAASGVKASATLPLNFPRCKSGCKSGWWIKHY